MITNENLAIQIAAYSDWIQYRDWTAQDHEVIVDYGKLTGLIEKALDEVEARGVKAGMRKAASIAIGWTEGKEREDYDTFSTASAISGAILRGGE